jgi:hypothetical protein
MASTINALTTGGGGIATTADSSGILQLQTNNGTTALTLDTSQNATFAGNIVGKQSGLVQPYQYYSLNTTYAGANVTTVQSIFGLTNGFTLAGSTIYEFESSFWLNKTAGTTSSYVSLLFGGTATLNNINYMIIDDLGSSLGIGVTATNVTVSYNNTASATQISPADTTATRYLSVFIKGIVSVNASGTFLPQYQLSAAPGGAWTTQIGSYFKITPLGASGSNIAIGTVS